MTDPRKELTLERSARKCSYGFCKSWLRYYDALDMLEHDKMAFEYSVPDCYNNTSPRGLMNVTLLTFKTRDSIIWALDKCYAFNKFLPGYDMALRCRVILINKKKVKEYNNRG
jgi:hypothetical protein